MFSRIHQYFSLYILYFVSDFQQSRAGLQSHCHPLEFRCSGTGKCISRNQVRNGLMNCGNNDTSDEDRALPKCQPQSEFRCRGNGQCVPRDWINRRIYLCSDGSDEGGIEHFPCNKKTEFRCEGRGRCIKRDKVDNRVVDCYPYGSDENVGGLACDTRTEFTCWSSLRCIPRRQVLDGKKDCIGGEDEEPTSKLKNCYSSSGEFQCDNGRCIERYLVGNGYGDCHNRGDEEPGAITQCFEESEFQCGSGDNDTSVQEHLHCIPSSWVNDGIPQCNDGSDERVISLWCFLEDWSCDEGKRCIPRSQLCDGILDCEDGSDETNDKFCSSEEQLRFFRCAQPSGLGDEESNLINTCSSDQAFGCRINVQEEIVQTSRKHGFVSSHYTLRVYFCDGAVDCGDGSDERQVGEGFKCRITRNKRGHLNRKTCVLPPELINDGITDCDDGSDEDSFQQSLSDKTSCFTNRLKRTQNKSDLIKVVQVCDGVFDCGDLSDECLCSAHKLMENSTEEICRRLSRSEADEAKSLSKGRQSCAAGKISCSDTESDAMKCLHQHSICDGVSDCRSGLDEMFCVDHDQGPSEDASYAGSDFQCLLSSKLEKLSETFSEIRKIASRCDGIPECPGLSDECDETTSLKGTLCKSRRKTPKYCKFLTGVLLCNKLDPLSEPLHPGYVCNGKIECQNGIDERYCDDIRFTCDVIQPSGFFDQILGSNTDKIMKERKVSIARTEVCDGRVDCVDQSDEKNCSNHFYCHDGRSPYFVSKRSGDTILSVVAGSYLLSSSSVYVPMAFRFQYQIYSSNSQSVCLARVSAKISHKVKISQMKLYTQWRIQQFLVVGDDQDIAYFRFFLYKFPLVNCINIRNIKRKTQSANAIDAIKLI